MNISQKKRDFDMHDLDSLNEFTSSITLLAILHTLRDSVGPKVLNNAITQVLSSDDPSKFLLSNKRKKQKGKKQKGKIFDMKNYAKRSVAIKFLYFGEKYAGFARQDHMEETVEKYIFDALKRTKLIDSIEECNYSRCGRTDKGVSAFGQVIGATLRSNLPTNAEMIDFDSLDEVHAGQKFRVKMPDGTEKTITEIDYPTHINRSLPKDIRVYSVVSAPIDFHARFQARGRTYRYFFVKKNMDITKMQAAANLLVGQHDFRNFCRIDLTAQTFERTIKYFKVFKCPHNTANNPEDQLYFFEIYGQAFLWHQVRCMVGILFMVGKGKEEPSLISRLLDIKVTPRKPQYDMAPDLPLVLHDCSFDHLQLDYSPLAMYHVHDDLVSMWEEYSIKAAIVRSNLETLDSFVIDKKRAIRELDHFPSLERNLEGKPEVNGMVRWNQVWPILPFCSRKKYIPVFGRNTGDSVEEKRQKLEEKDKRKDLKDEL